MRSFDSTCLLRTADIAGMRMLLVAALPEADSIFCCVYAPLHQQLPDNSSTLVAYKYRCALHAGYLRGCKKKPGLAHVWMNVCGESIV